MHSYSFNSFKTTNYKESDNVCSAIKKEDYSLSLA